MIALRQVMIGFAKFVLVISTFKQEQGAMESFFLRDLFFFLQMSRLQKLFAVLNNS